MSPRRALLLALLSMCLTTPLFAQATASTDLSIDKTVNPLVGVAGQPFTFTLLVTNIGPSPATGVTVNDPLPVGMTASSATSTVGTCSGTTTITCNVGSLAVGATATITIVATAAAAGDYSNTATVTSPLVEINALNNSDTVRATAAAAPNPVPAVSPLGLAGLALLLGAAALVALRVR